MRLMALVFLGSGVGGSLRYWIDGMVGPRGPAQFPVATFGINVVGSLILGALVKWSASPGAYRPEWMALLAVGLCGGFTTFSAFSVETMRLLQSGEMRTASIYVIGSVAISLLAAWTGYSALTGLRP